MTDHAVPTLESIVARIAGRLPRFFPLDAFVASNPLRGFEDRAFDDALREAADWFGARTHPDLEMCRRLVASEELGAAALRDAIAARAPERSLGLAGRHRTLPDFLLARTLGKLDVDDASGLEAEGYLHSAAERLAQGPAAAGAGPSEGDAADRWQPRRERFVDWLDRHTRRDDALRLDALTIPVLQHAAFAGDRSLAAPAGARGLYAAFRHRLLDDEHFARVAARSGSTLGVLMPEAVETVVAGALGSLGCGADGAEPCLARHAGALVGWSSFLASRDGDGHAALLELLAMRLAAERLLYTEAAVGLGVQANASALVHALAGCEPVRGTSAVRRLAATARWLELPRWALGAADDREIAATLALFDAYDEAWLALRAVEAFENAFRKPLLDALSRHPGETTTTRARAQCVFCIDVRSEPLRAELEQDESLETYGFAGFFGVAVAIAREDGSSAPHCPAIVEPGWAVRSHTGGEGTRSQARRQVSGVAGRSKFDPLAGSAFVEGLGLFAFPAMLRDVFSARGTRRRADGLVEEGALGLEAPDTAAQAAIARGLFELTGLRFPLARLVVLCGHGSTTANNPFASALACGACGGQDGAANARLLARYLNRAEVRALLAQDGYEIPEDVVFVAALHDTTRDTVEILDRAHVPDSHAGDLASLERALAAAGTANRRRRMGSLGTHGDGRSAFRRSRDFSEVRPEWGLARNAALVVGRRWKTRGLDFGGRCFLHSYDYRADGDGKLLDQILSAPMIVAQWINAQYFFATANNEAFGSGSKVTQNVVGGAAVMQGECGDLCLGLPEQSVMRAHGEPYHVPMRLLVAIDAPKEFVAEVLARNAAARRLLDNAWISLAVVDPDARIPFLYQPGGGWQMDHAVTANPIPISSSGAVA